MFRYWSGAFTVPVLMLLYAGLSVLLPGKLGYPRAMTAERKKLADRTFLRLLWQCALAFAALNFMLMQSTRLLEPSIQRGAALAVSLAEAVLAVLLALPVERALRSVPEAEEASVTEQAPAKVNLLLNVGQKRPDGYHELVSIMQTVDVCDTLTVTGHTGGGGVVLTCDDPSLAVDETNLCYNAAVKLFSYTEIANDGVSIHLRKRLPMQAGLGGGSADAAAVLRALRRIYAPDLPDTELEAMAAELGSDVPFCVRGGTTLTLGRGERLAPLPPLPACWFVLVKPEAAYSTGKMYGLIDSRGCYDAGGAGPMADALERGDLDGVCAALRNTFERVLDPEGETFALKRRLAALGARGAMLSGSGSAVFGVFADEETARMACAALRADYPRTFCGKSR